MNANENYGRDDRSRRTQQDANAFNEDRQARLERLQKELHTLESGSDDQKSKLISRDLDRQQNKPDFSGNRPFGRFERNDRGTDRPFNREGGRSFERRDDRGGERPSFNREGRPPFERRDGDSRPPFQRRDDRGGDRPAFNREGGPRNFERPAGDRPPFNREGGPRNFDRPAGDRPPFNREGGRPYERREGFAPRRDDRGGDRPAFNRSNDRNDRGNSRFGDRRSTGNRDNRSGFNAPDSRRRGRLTELDFPAKPQTIVFDQPMRLNRYIANSGICSRRRADELITAGEIFINGTAVTELGSRVQPGDVVTYNGRTLSLETLVYVLLNKPKDFITTLDDPEERRTVMNLVKNATEERIVPVGRLDRNTTGLLVLTNDGELTQKLTHPSNNIAKVYDVVLDKPLTEAHFNQIAEGVTLDDGLATVDAIAYPNPEDKCEVGVEIHSGRNRIVRRIFESLGYDVVKLDRVFYAGITKKDLPRGNWRYLTPKEITRLKSM